MKPFKIILIIALCIFGCKKDDVHRPYFTSDQLEWIQNLTNPKYKVVTIKKGITSGGILFLDSTVTVIDTVSTQTTSKVERQSSTSVGWPEGSGSTTHYSEGTYDFKFVNFYNFIKGSIVGISNYSPEFRVGVFNGNPLEKSTDTATVNGVVYENVYKFMDSDPSYGIFYQIYFKKGIGFLYLEKDSIVNSRMVIYTASLIQ